MFKAVSAPHFSRIQLVAAPRILSKFLQMQGISVVLQLDWLETAATRFAQIDPNLVTAQPLINPAMPGYNFDMFTDKRISYEIDVTQPLPPVGLDGGSGITTGPATPAGAT